MKNYEIMREEKFREIAIDLLDQALRDRAKRWLSVAAFIWAITLIFLQESRSPQEGLSPQDLMAMFSISFIILIVTWSYAKASVKLICLLKYCDAILLDESEKFEKSI